MSTEYGAPTQSKGNFPIWAWCLIVPCCGILLLVPILAAVLFPVFAQARESARGASCMTNVKQQALAALMYCQDYDEVLPAADNWMDLTGPYRKEEYALHCPSVSQPGATTFGYAYNSELSRKSLAEVADPRTTTMCYDSSNLAKNAADAVQSLPNPPRHRKGNNVGYVDGHARANLPGVDERTEH